MNLLTVIVPVYNTQALVGRCIKSIQASTYSKYRFAEKIAYVDEIVYEYLIRSSTSSAGTSAIQIKDYPHYLDELRWRAWTLQYINSSDKLQSAYKHQLGDFCPVIDREWLNYSEEQRKQCFDVLRDIVARIDWKETDMNPKGFLQIEPDKLLNMDEKRYTGHLNFVLKVIQPIKGIIGR